MNSEIEIIKAIAAGREEALALLYDLYAEKIYNISLNYTKNPKDAEEVTQDVFVKVYKSASLFKGASSVNTWIYRITVNTSLNYLKKKQRFLFLRNTFKRSTSSDFEHPGVLMENKENAKALYKAMTQLPKHQKTAFILSYIDELPRQEVADIMETSLKAVESLLQRAKKKLRAELEKIYPHRRNLKK